MYRAKILMVLYSCNRVIDAINDKYHNKLPPALNDRLAPLRELMKKLDQAWSEMAGRNLMADIVRCLTTFEQQLQAGGLSDLKAVFSDTAKFVKKVLAKHDPTKSKYATVL